MNRVTEAQGKVSIARCVPTFEFFDTEEEMRAWLAGGS
jgi:hypothetical protein